MAAFAYTTWAERKVLGRLQIRYGPNRAGTVRPAPVGRRRRQADHQGVRGPGRTPLALHRGAVTLVPAVTVYALIPFGRGLVITDVNVGLR